MFASSRQTFAAPTGSPICSNAPLAARPMTCADPTQASAIRPEAGQSHVGWSQRSNGIRTNFIRASASSSLTWRPAENVVAFYNKRGTCEQWIKEGKGAIKWTRLSCRAFAANAVRLQLHALAYNVGNFLRTLATPEPIKDWSMTSLKEKLIKIGARRSSATADMLPSRWPRSPSHRICSPILCGSSRSFARRRLFRQRDAFCSPASADTHGRGASR
jgi:hypothetical protein